MHPGPVQWPGVNGLPFLGDGIPNLKRNELEQLPIVGFKGVDQFDLSDPGRALVYKGILERVRNGIFTLDFIDRHKIEYKDEEGRPCVKWVAHVEWTQLYVTMPPQMPPGGTRNGRPASDFILGG